MTTLSKTALVLALSLAPLLSHAKRVPQAWDIVLQPRASVGQQLVHTFDTVKDLVAGQGDAKKLKQYVAATGKLRTLVTAVDKHGRITKATATVVELMVKTSPTAKASPATITGQKIRVSRLPPKARFEREDGQLIPKPELEVLGLFYTTHRRQQTDDELFGPGRIVRAGEQWQPNIEKLAQSLTTGLGFKSKVSGVTCSMRLASAKRIEGQYLLAIRGRFSIAKFTMESRPGAVGRVKAKLESDLRSNGGAPLRKAMHLTMELDLGDGMPIRAQRKMTRTLVTAK